MVGNRVGGVNVFGGGLALYASGGKKVGGVGVSGDTSCTDHIVAWRVRNTLQLDHLGTSAGCPGDPTHPDNIIFDITSRRGLPNRWNGHECQAASAIPHASIRPI